MNKFKILDDGLLINKISKTYGNKEVVRDISLSIKRGEIVGLLGPNGAGKTTTFYVIVGLVKPDTGSIYLDKVEISNLPIYIRGKIGISYLPQEASIFRGMNVEDNIMSIIEIVEKDKQIQEIILQNLLNEFDLNHVRKSKSIVLSGGERRRLEIARTLASNPKYLLLDEPLTGIDPVSIEEIKIIIRKLKNKNIGILITDHNVRETLKIIDKVYIVNEGAIFFEGDPKSAVNDDRIKKFYLGVLSAALAYGTYAEIICDKLHVSSEAIKIAKKSINKLYAVTDSVSVNGLQDGEYKLFNNDIVKKGNTIKLKNNNTLAGSVVTMYDIFINLIELGYDLNEAVEMTSSNAAEFLNLDNVGHIKENYLSNFIVLDKKYKIKDIYLKGEKVEKKLISS